MLLKQSTPRHSDIYVLQCPTGQTGNNCHTAFLAWTRTVAGCPKLAVVETERTFRLYVCQGRELQCHLWLIELDTVRAEILDEGDVLDRFEMACSTGRFCILLSETKKKYIF